MKKRINKMVILIVIVFGGLIAFNVIKQSVTQYYLNHYQVPAVTVSALPAKQVDWYPYFSSVGTFVATNGVDINTQSPGNVTAIYFTSGQYIEKDSPLIDIDDKVEQAQLKFHQANLALQKTNYQRQSDLLKRKATAVSNVDEARATLLQAEANVENMQATINLKHIKAPFTGQLGIRQIDLGQYLEPGKTPIVSLQSLDPIYMRFYIPEQHINRIKIDQNIIFTVEQNPGIHFNGKITAIDSKIDDKTHNIQVQAVIENCPALQTEEFLQSDLTKDRKQLADGRFVVTCSTALNQAQKREQFNFIPGMFADVEIEQPAIHNAIVIPTTAISYTMYGDSVFVIEKGPDNSSKDIFTVKRVYVTAGETRGNYTLITKGIHANQLIVTAGDLKLQNGSQVIIDPNQALLDHDDINLLGE